MTFDNKKDRRSVSLRRCVLLIFVIGTVGLGTELLLLDHFEEWRQQVPLVLLALGLILLAVRLLYRGAIILRLFRWTMLAFVLGGMVGLWFHLSSNMEFELEMHPTLSGSELLFKSIERRHAGIGTWSTSPARPDWVSLYLPTPGTDPGGNKGELIHAAHHFSSSSNHLPLR